jgi:hypothetical protein
MLSQVADSGHPILQEGCGKVNVSCSKTPEITGTCKQYSGRTLPGFYPVNSYPLPVLSGRHQPEIIGKNPKNFGPEHCFHKITGITRNRPFLDHTVRSGFLISLLQLKHMVSSFTNKNQVMHLISCTFYSLKRCVFHIIFIRLAKSLYLENAHFR